MLAAQGKTFCGVSVEENGMCASSRYVYERERAEWAKGRIRQRVCGLLQRRSPGLMMSLVGGDTQQDPYRVPFWCLGPC